MKKLTEFFTFFEIQKIYLPPALCASPGQFIDDVRQPVAKFAVYVQIPRLTDRTAQEKIDAWTKVTEIFDNEIQKARESLEVEFRRILGAN